MDGRMDRRTGGRTHPPEVNGVCGALSIANIVHTYHVTQDDLKAALIIFEILGCRILCQVALNIYKVLNNVYKDKVIN